MKRITERRGHGQPRKEKRKRAGCGEHERRATEKVVIDGSKAKKKESGHSRTSTPVLYAGALGRPTAQMSEQMGETRVRLCKCGRAQDLTKARRSPRASPVLHASRGIAGFSCSFFRSLALDFFLLPPLTMPACVAAPLPSTGAVIIPPRAPLKCLAWRRRMNRQTLSAATGPSCQQAYCQHARRTASKNTHVGGPRPFAVPPKEALREQRGSPRRRR